MSQNIMGIADEMAEQFYITKDKKYFNEFVKHFTPIIQRMVYKSCAGALWNTDDLFSILLADMWRLFNCWEPEEGKQFHWLALRQLKNKIINYIQQVRGRPHKTCNVCNTKQKAGATVCSNCGSSLRLPDIIVSGIFDFVQMSYTPDYLEDIGNRQLVDKLLVYTKAEDLKTYKILQLLLEGKSKSEISREMALAQNAINNRIKKCKKIINNLVGEKNNG